MENRMKWLCFSAAFFLLYLASLPAMATTVWEPTGGLQRAPVNALAVSPIDSQTIYVGSTNGVAKSTDRGNSWNAANTGLGNSQVFALAIDKDGRIYLGTDNGIFKSTDGAQSWTAINTGLSSTHVWALAIDPSNSQTIYAGSSRAYPTDTGGVFKSTDGGSSWTATSSGLTSTDVASIAIDPTAPQTVYVGTGSNGGATGRGIFKSADGGASWNEVNTGLSFSPDFTVVTALASGSTTPQRLFAGTWWGSKTNSDGGAYTGVYRSSDGGSSWSEVYTGQVSAVAIDPSNEATIYAGTWNGVFQSTDGGDTWNPINTNLTSTNVYSLAIDAASQIVYAGTNAGAVYKGVAAVIGGIPATSVMAGSTYRFTPSAPNATSFSITNMPYWASFDTATGTLTGTPSTGNIGAYNNIVISATFYTTKVSLPPFSITVLLPMPLISGTPATSVTAGNTYSFTPTSSYAASFSIANKPSWAYFTTATGQLTGTPTNADAGDYSGITISAVNSTGSTALAPFTVRVSLPMPRIYGTPAGSVVAGSSYSFTPSAANATSFTVANKPAWASFNTATGALSGTPALADAGVYQNIVISAVNSTGTASLPAFSITVTVPSPSISGTPATTVTTGQQYRFTPSASYAASFTIANKPAWASFDPATGTLSGTPGASDTGAYPNIVISAVNATATAALSAFTITVLPPLPTISGVPATSVTAGQPYRFTPTATNAASFSITNKPAWAGFDTGTGTLSGTPADADAGTYANIGISAVNAAGSAALPAFSIAVAPATTPVPVLVISALPDGSVTSNRTLNISGMVTCANGLKSLTINGQGVPVNGDGSFAWAVVLAEGANVITVAATDFLDYRTVDSRTITLDSTGPTITILTPADSSVTAATAITVTGTVSEPCTVAVSVNDAAAVPAVMNGNDFSAAISLAAGTNTIIVTVTDRAGNVSVAKRTVVSDPSKPSLAITDPNQDIVTAASSYLVRGTAGDANTAVTVVIAVDGKVFTPTVTDGAFAQQIDLADEKQYAIVATATDLAGNVATVQRNIIVSRPVSGGGTLPTISGTPATDVTVGYAYRFTPTATDATGFTITSKPSWAAFDAATGTLTGAPRLADAGTYSGIVISAVNAAGTASLPGFAITVTVPPRPTVSGSPATAVTVGQSYLFTPSATDAATFSITGKPSWAAFDAATGTLSGTPQGADVGSYPNIVISAVNAAGSASLPAFTITVALPLPPLPTISGTPATSVTAGQSYHFTPTASNAASFSITGKPAWAAFDSAAGTLSGTPQAADAASYPNIVIGAVNAAGSASLPAFTITVALPLPPLPTISGTPATSVTAGQSYRFTPSATDAASFSITGKPAWAAFDSATGALSGTPQAADAGSYSDIVISALNAAGSAALAPFTITVTTPVTPPSLFLSTLADQSVTSNATLNISGRVSCPNGLKSLTINGASVPVNADGSFSYAIMLTEGANGISAVLTDNADLTASEHRTIILDRTAAAISIAAPADGSITPATSVTVTGTVSEPGTVSVAVNGAAPTAAAMNGTDFSATVPLAAGTNTIIVTMTDRAGNSTVAKRTVISDPSKPSLAITDPGQDVTITEHSYLVKGTAGDAQTATTVTIAVDGQIFTPALTNGAFEQTITFAAEKQYAVVATATDQAGNSSTVQRNIIVTLAPSGAGLPTISGTPATSVTAGQSYLFTPSASGATSFSIASKPSWAAFDTATGTLSGIPQNADAGTYSGIVISAVNTAGAAALPAFAITVVSTLPPLPTISGTPALSVAAGENYHFTPTATDAASFTITSKPTWAAFDAATGTLSGTPGTADAGSYANIVISAANAAGAAALPAFTITVTTSAPPTSTPPTLTISTLADQSITNNATLNVSGSVLCPNGLDSFTINGTAVTVNGDGSFTYAVTLTEGANVITAEVTDRAGYRKTDSRTIILDRTAPSITIASPADGSVTSAASVAVSGTVSEAGTVSIAVNGGTPVAAPLTGTSFAATVNLAAGTNTITVSTTDRAGNSATAKRTIISDRSSPSLSITDPGQDITITGRSYLLKGQAGDADTPTTVTVAVDGLSFTPSLANGSFEQPLTFAAEKQYTVVVTATDQGGNRATVQRNIVVAKPLKGDLNGDGNFDISDAQKVYQAVMGRLTLTPEESAAADVAPLSADTGQPTGNNIVDIADVIIILRRIVGAVTW